MDWLGDLLSKLLSKIPSLLKGITECLYAVFHWKDYRDRYKELDEHTQILLRYKDELHGLDKKKLEEELAEWRQLAVKGLGKYEDAISLIEKAASDLADLSTALSIILFFEQSSRRDILLSTLNPSARLLVEATLAKLPALSLAALSAIRVQTLSEALKAADKASIQLKEEGRVHILPPAPPPPTSQNP